MQDQDAKDPSGNPVAGEKVFCEGFGAFELGSILCRAKDRQAGFLEGIDHAVHQRRFL